MFWFVLGAGLLLASVPHYDWSGHGGWGGALVTFLVLLGLGMVWRGLRDLIASAFEKAGTGIRAKVKGSTE